MTRSSDNQLIQQLQSLRARARRRLLLYGLCAVLGGGMLSFITVLTLDWLLWLPPILRILGAGFFIVGFITAMYHWVIRPLRVPMGIEVIAHRLEQHFHVLRDQLRSTVEFLRQPDAGSPPMMRRVIEQTSHKLQNLPLRDVLIVQPLAVRASWLAAGTVTFVLLLSLAPSWVQIGLQRYIHPFGQIEWPRSIAVESLTGDKIVALGDALIIRMRVTRGFHDSLRPILYFRDQSGEESRIAMQPAEKGEFHATMDAVTRELIYWFEAGDENTRREPRTIQVVKRPEVSEVWTKIEPPPYAAEFPAQTHDLVPGPVRATVGGHATITVKPSKHLPTGTDNNSSVNLLLEDGQSVVLQADSESSETWSARMPLERDLIFRIELRDEWGFENRGSPQYTVLAAPDVPPAVAIVEPRSMIDCTAKATVPLVVQVEDDFGLTVVELIAEKTGANQQLGSWPLENHVVRQSTTTGVQGTVRYRWILSSMTLAPGDIISYVVAATDNRLISQTEGQVSRSASQRIKIISDVEFETRLRDDIAMLETRIRQAMIEQVDMLDRTASLVRKEGDSPELTLEEQESLSNLSTAQTRAGRRIVELARRFRELAEQMELNQSERESIAQVHALSAALQRVAGEPMAEAAKSLTASRDANDDQSRQNSIRKAVESEQTASTQLQALLRTMSQWGNFQGLLTKTRDLLDRQESLRHRTQELGQETLGKNVAELTPAEVASLKRAARLQEQLAADVEQLLDRMRQAQNNTESKEAAAAEVIEAALRAASAHDLARRMQSAAESLNENRTAAAAIDQKNAVDAMRGMISAMQERDARELAQLRKRLDRAEEHVAQLLQEQKELQTATREAGSTKANESAFILLAQEQHTLQRNTTSVADDLADLDAAESAARMLRQSAKPMNSAGEQLQRQKSDDAVALQEQAIQFLSEALTMLEELAEQSAREELRRTLAQIREDLEAIAAAQRALNEGITKIKATVDAQQKLGRSEAREVNRLAQKQAEVRELVDTMRPDFEQIAVYRWAVERVAGWMDQSRNRLETRKVDDELIQIVNRVVRELDRLIAAVNETQSMPMDTEFLEAGEGEGGNGPTPEGASVPPLAELLVIKALQLDIQARTQAVQDEIGKTGSNESRLRELQRIGEEQAEVQALTAAVTRRAQQP